jgi:SAM-dependent methyltransferase
VSPISTSLAAPTPRLTTRVHIVTPRRPIPEPQGSVDSANRRTIDSYERIAGEYADDTAPDPSGAGEFSGAGLRRLVDAVPAGGTALEVGSGPGWDADFLESQGVAVRRTEVAAAFIDLQADRGKHVEKLDITTDELGGPYDAVIALAVLQHVERAQIPAFLRRMAAALHPGGVFLVAVREGFGERWEVGDSGNPYFTVLWSESTFRTLLGDAGLEVEWRFPGNDSEEDRWLMLLARKEF